MLHIGRGVRQAILNRNLGRPAGSRRNHRKQGLHWFGNGPDRHHTQIGQEIAGVTVITSPRHPARLTEAAHEAFLALGYTIEDTRSDIYGHQFCDGHHSKHEAIQAYARIEGALRSWRSG